MQYKDFIKINETFQYSINLQYDYNKLNKLSAYIPTKASMDILEDYIKSIYYPSKERARVLVGPYGKGKSHLILVLLALIAMKGDEHNRNQESTEEIIEDLTNKINLISSDTAELIKNVRKEKKPLMPVIVNGNYTDLKQAFLVALMDALKRENLNELIPRTYFEVIKEVVEKWRNDFPNTYELFLLELKNNGITINEFLAEIELFHEKSYELFKKIHPMITSGTEFNPLIQSDIVTLYKEVNTRICNEEEYDGMFIVFDEFSKFLVSGVISDDTLNVKILQDLAELANRSDEEQFHLSCITHKSINDYIAQLPKEKIDAWRTVEGRFKEIYFTSSSDQNYELIGNSIIKDKELFEEFICNNKEDYSNIIDDIDRYGTFSNIANYDNVIGKDCFPLNPLTTYVLPRVSEKVAQNERTLFTFLSLDDNGSLVRFINKNNGELDFVGLDSVYDYFEILFKKEVFNTHVHNIWLESDSTLNKTNDINEKRVIKAIAIIYIVDEIDNLAPTDNYIRASLNMKKDEYEKTTKRLLDKGIVVKRKRNGYYGFINSSSINFEKSIKDTVELKSKNINLRETLEDIYELGYELPKRHNDIFEMVRYFKKIFVTAKEFNGIMDAEALIEFYNSDGLIIYIIYTDEEEKNKVKAKITELGNSRLIVNIPDKPFTKIDSIKEYYAIKYLINDNSFTDGDESIIHELSIYENDIVEDLKVYINNYFNINQKKCRYYDFEGEIDNIRKTAHVSKKISEICDYIYDKTPVINNELINKKKLTAPILKARNKVIQYLFEGKEDLINFNGNSPELTIFKATILNKGLNLNSSSFDLKDDGLKEVLIKIQEFILSTEDNERSFIELYDILHMEPYGIRDGVILIYLSFIMKDFKENVVLYRNKKEVYLEIDTLNQINNNPENYSMIIEKGTQEKVDYLKSLAELFMQYESRGAVGYNKFGYIVNLMKNWIQSLPKYSREFKVEYYGDEFRNLDKKIELLRKELLRLETNPREILFEIIPKKIFKTSSLDKCCKNIKKIKGRLDNHIIVLKSQLIKNTKEIFNEQYEGELSSILINWYKNLSDNSRFSLYDSDINRALSFIENLNNYDEEYVLDELAYIFTGLRVEDWNDNSLKDYIEKIRDMKLIVEEDLEEVINESNTSFKIIVSENGKEKEKLFNSTDISEVATTLYNEVEEIIEDFGESITIDEKRNVLMQLLQKLM